MLIDTLLEHERAYNNLLKEISDEKARQDFIDHADVATAMPLLESLIKAKVMQLPAFELMLKINKDAAIEFLKVWYLSLDLSDHVKDPVSGLNIILCHVKDILGENELNKLLNCEEFLPKNKKNKRVKEAIRFALEDD
ncbi:hypothetical protein [Snodgrassella communis]|uniref:hypothetical protein n=1 Tax=Snodgrassella communis TaxID=2946699 RepID=UPI001EF5E082|nr:hypothetical protein [Snodgrassella communis]